MSKLWYLVAIMFGVHEDGKADVYIFRDPKNSPGDSTNKTNTNIIRLEIEILESKVNEFKNRKNN